MRHYEIVFFAHPGQSEQIPSMIERYKDQVVAAGGRVHRIEDWGRRKLAYPVNKIHKAHYVLMNLSCDQQTLASIQQSFRFNDVILRHLVMAQKRPVTGESAMLRATKAEKEQEERERNRSLLKDVRASSDRPRAGVSSDKPAVDEPNVLDGSDDVTLPDDEQSQSQDNDKGGA